MPSWIISKVMLPVVSETGIVKLAAARSWSAAPPVLVVVDVPLIVYGITTAFPLAGVIETSTLCVASPSVPAASAVAEKRTTGAASSSLIVITSCPILPTVQFVPADRSIMTSSAYSSVASSMIVKSMDSSVSPAVKLNEPSPLK